MTLYVSLVGGDYVGCQVRVAGGTWQTGACRKPVSAWIPIADDLSAVVCEEHAALFEGQVAVVMPHVEPESFEMHVERLPRTQS